MSEWWAIDILNISYCFPFIYHYLNDWIRPVEDAIREDGGRRVMQYSVASPVHYFLYRDTMEFIIIFTSLYNR